MSKNDVAAAAATDPELGRYHQSDLQVDFEHGGWWVTHKPTGRQWSVVTTSNGLEFEVISEGDEPLPEDFA